MKTWKLMIGITLGLAFIFVCSPKSGDFSVPVAEAHGVNDGGMPCTFTYGQTLSSTCLNRNFSHIHDSFAGQITDQNLSASAAISHSKLQYPALLPKAWAVMKTDCSTGTCTLEEFSRVASITWAATGQYNVTLSYTPAVNAHFLVLATPYGAARVAVAMSESTTPPHFKVYVYDLATHSAANGAFSVLVLDDEGV